MNKNRKRVSSGVAELDHILEGLYIGDNVVWYDDAGSLASVFYLNFIRSTQALKKPLIYVSFDRSPRNLLEKLGPLADDPRLTILDCFTRGKGAASDVFLRFYEKNKKTLPCSIIQVDDPSDVNSVMDAFYGTHAQMKGEVRFVFESLTGMQELWGGEDHIINFYAHSCPRLYELRTIAYWVIEKEAHSQQLRAKINQVAQVAIDLSVKRGKTAMTVLKAEGRPPDTLNKPHHYWHRDLTVTFDEHKHDRGPFDLGGRLKALRTRRGISQTGLARLVGVTPSTISQVEGNLIYPSLPALFKMAQVLSVDAGALLRVSETAPRPALFPATDAVKVKLSNLPKGIVSGKLLTPPDLEARIEPYLLEIPPKSTLPNHFFIHKGEEIGYVLSGRLQMEIDRTLYKARPGDLIYLTAETPSRWKNPGSETARLLWIKIKAL